jgi:galactose mutarotase-like enzyme
MNPRISQDTVSGHPALVLENDHLRASIVPALGGRVWQLEDLKRGVPWIWHRPGVPPAAHAPGADYDAVWAGGWEELFPNDAAAAFEGRDLPDHGEWWARSWEVDAIEQGDDVMLRLSCRMSVIRARCTKEFRLAAGSAELEIRYRIESEEAALFHFLFKQHLPLRIGPTSRIVVPGGTVTAVDPSFGTVLPGPGPHTWPMAHSAAGASVDLSRVLPASSATREFVYVSALPAAWCGVDDAARGASLRMHWRAEEMPFLWLFITYGGWRDAYTVVLEPCSNLPKDLPEAVKRRQAAALAPGGVFETTVRVRLSAWASA